LCVKLKHFCFEGGESTGDETQDMMGLTWEKIIHREMGLNSWLCVCKTRPLPLKPQFILLVIILEIGSLKLFAWAGLEL
jgi:hypothetical protein